MSAHAQQPAAPVGGAASSSAGAQLPDPPTVPAPTSASQAALLLDAGDLLEVRVFDTPELSGKLRVDNAGQITLPVGGAIAVKGLTAEQAQLAIEQRFREARILREPHVEVLVLEYATQGVTVAGEVKLPGVYPWTGKHTVLDFISIAGGLTPAASHQVVITGKGRAAPAATVTLGGDPQQPAHEDQVQPGDRIVVPRAGVVYVVGDVGRPGGYLVDDSGAITVLQALALAQGMNKTAKYDAKLIRNTAAGRVESDLPLKRILANAAVDPQLRDGDILFVPVSGGKEWADKGVTSVLQMAVGVVIYGRL